MKKRKDSAQDTSVRIRSRIIHCTVIVGLLDANELKFHTGHISCWILDRAPLLTDHNRQFFTIKCRKMLQAMGKQVHLSSSTSIYFFNTTQGQCCKAKAKVSRPQWDFAGETFCLICRKDTPQHDKFHLEKVNKCTSVAYDSILSPIKQHQHFWPHKSQIQAQAVKNLFPN